MPRSLPPIPLGSAIAAGDGTITVFFRQLWNILLLGFGQTPTAAKASNTGADINAAVATTTLFTTTNAGDYRVTSYARKTVADGVSSSLQLTIGWVEGGTAQTHVFPAMATDSTTSPDSQTWTVRADAASAITFAWAYASNTPGTMRYVYDVLAELMV